MLRIVLLFCLSAVLTACGQKGPLYLPAKAPAAPAPDTGPAASPAPASPTPQP